MPRIVYFFLLIATSCHGESVGLLGRPDASATDADRDAGDIPDADAPDMQTLAPDMGFSDRGVDGSVGDTGQTPPPDLSLGEGLTCGLSADDRVRAAVRHVACSPDTRATVPGLIEALDAGLMGNFSGAVDNWLNFNVRQGCAYWECVSRAASCGRVMDECLPAVSNIACGVDDRGDATCDGSRISYCDFEGSRIVADCADFGAECADGACVKNGCVFGAAPNGDTGLSCSDDGTRLQVCAGSFEMACDAWAAGSSCSSFAIQGELPTSWCSPTGQPSGGAYAREDFDCVAQTLRMETETRGAVQFDCASAGFTGCAQRGCASL